jgi:hypothetical protein
MAGVLLFLALDVGLALAADRLLFGGWYWDHFRDRRSDRDAGR